MYIILGESTLVWTNVGEFNSGTQVTVGGSNVATFNADSKQNRINFNSPLYSSNDNVGLNYGTGLTVDSSNGGLRLDLSASSPISVYDNYIQLDYGNGLTTDGSGYLVIQAGDGITADSGSVSVSDNVLNYPGLHSTTGSYIQDNYGNIKINGSERVETYSKKHNIYNDNFGFMLTPDGIILGTYSGSTGEIDKTKPYIEITSTAVNIKGLNSIT